MSAPTPAGVPGPMLGAGPTLEDGPAAPGKVGALVVSIVAGTGRFVSNLNLSSSSVGIYAAS